MYESRNLKLVLVSVLLLGSTVGMAYADTGSTDGMNLDLRNQPVTETLVADLASDSSMKADTESLELAVESDCASDTALTAALGMETVVSASVAPSGWTCGPCSVSACANLPVGNPCGLNRWCVVSTTCSTQPLTDRCVCGTDHY